MVEKEETNEKSVSVKSFKSPKFLLLIFFVVAPVGI